MILDAYLLVVKILLISNTININFFLNHLTGIEEKNPEMCFKLKKTSTWKNKQDTPENKRTNIVL